MIAEILDGKKALAGLNWTARCGVGGGRNFSGQPVVQVSLMRKLGAVLGQGPARGCRAVNRSAIICCGLVGTTADKNH